MQACRQFSANYVSDVDAGKSVALKDDVYEQVRPPAHRPALRVQICECGIEFYAHPALERLFCASFCRSAHSAPLDASIFDDIKRSPVAHRAT